MSNDAGCELLFFNEHCEYIAQATSLKDAEWATQSCTLGWGVKGLWPKVNDGTFYQCCDRSSEGAELATPRDWFHAVIHFALRCVVYCECFH